MPGGEKPMKKMVLVLLLAFVALVVLAAPVLAIGPENVVGKNPNLSPVDYGAALNLENGLSNEWVTVIPVPQHHMVKNASDFRIENAFVVTDPIAQFDQLENKWAYYSQEMFAQLLYKVFPFPEPAARQIASMYPEGAYFRWTAVGQ